MIRRTPWTGRDRAVRASGRALLRRTPSPEAQPPVSVVGAVVLFVSLAFLIAGIVWPQAAESLLRLFLATLAGGFVMARAHRTVVAMRRARDDYSPFNGLGVAPPQSPAPHVLREMATRLGAADDAKLAERTPIPRAVRWTVVEEASRRLAERHGLNLDDPGHHPRIRSLVSEATWAVIAPGDAVLRQASAARPGSGPVIGRAGGGRFVPLSRLHHVLDDLEAL